MLGLAKKYSEKHGAKIKFKVGNILSIPLTENDFDFVISIAVLHHLDSEKKRLRALREIKKVLKPKGKVFITVWNSSLLEASAFCKRLQYPKSLAPNQKDAYIPWTRKGVKYNRYYHFFDQDELKGLFEKSGFKRIRIFEDGRGKNLCVVAEC